MKRYIRSSELPAGYLKTNRFNSIIKDNNVLEAIEIAIAQKYDQFERFMQRQSYLTSDASWTGVVDQYPEGYYIQLEGTRSGFNAFVSGDQVIRKPVRLGEKIGKFDVDGNNGYVYNVSRNRLDTYVPEKTNGWDKRGEGYVFPFKGGSAQVYPFYEDEEEGYYGKVAKNGVVNTYKFFGEGALNDAMTWCEMKIYH